MLGIIGAMEIEVEALKKAMTDVSITEKAGMQFYKGKIAKKDVVVVKSGVGKVNAGICTQILVDIFDVDAVINTGVAGSLNHKIDICDIVISKEAQQHDMDVTALGYHQGVIPDMEESVFKADETLMELAKTSAKEAGLDVNIYEGKILSGDQFIGTVPMKEFLKKEFCGDCAEMEGAAVAHAASRNRIPFLIIRAISDKADGEAEMDYPAFERKAAKNSIKLMKKMIENYEKDKESRIIKSGTKINVVI